MTYTVISDSDLVRFERQINEYLAKGYQPVGGIAVKFAYRTNGDNIQSYLQAMVLP